jgi:hypothetical protein
VAINCPCQNSFFHIVFSQEINRKAATMKTAILATLIAGASAFSVNKAAFTQVRNMSHRKLGHEAAWKISGLVILGGFVSIFLLGFAAPFVAKQDDG